MIIKELIMENITSHESTKIEFAEGKTLIRGQSGAGKSSIVESIKSALFGKYLKELITKGKENGKIELTFEIKDQNETIKKYTVIRKFTKGGPKGAIIYHNEKKSIDYSTEELTREITKILKINQKTKAEEIFDAFVYAEQKQLESLIIKNTKKDIEKRTKIIMEAFEMEGYQFARENSERLIKKIYDTTKIRNAQIKEIPELETNKKELSEEINKKKINLEELTKTRKIKKTYYELKKEDYDKVKEERTKISSISTLITSKENEIKEKKEEIIINNEKSAVKKSKIEKTGMTIEQIKKGMENLKSLNQLEEIRNKLIDEINHLEINRGRKGDKATRYQGIRDEGKCDTCGREINDISEYDELISAANIEKSGIENEINKKNEEKESIQNKIRETTEMKILESDVEEIDEVKEKNKKLNEKIVGLMNEIEQQKNELKKLPDENKLKILENECKNAEKDFRDKEDRLTVITTQIDDQTISLNKEQVRLEKLKQKKIEMEYLRDVSEWLDKYFITTLQSIEEIVLHTLKEKFNELFKEWFDILVEDESKTVMVDEEFTPILRQNGVEQVFRRFSGGEEACIALAYRLALNDLMRKQSTGFRPELFMLDEPTAANDEIQVSKISNLLSNIENKQVIIISHSDELANADQVIKVTKDNNVSKIQIESIYGD
tara:strand:- start:1022 stop:3022 length:2001 start_codon:yes stop_codon:yes gene_type:complete